MQFSSQAIASAAVPNGGTLTFNYPAGTSAGHYKINASRHLAYARGLQALLSWPTDFSLTFNATNITFTYLGATPIPAGTVVNLQLETSGDNAARDFQDNLRIQQITGGVYGPRSIALAVHQVLFGAPSTISTTAVLATTAVTDTALKTLATPVDFDAPRAVQIVSSNAGDTARTITIRGLDDLNQPMTEIITLNGTTPVFGAKAFKRIISYQASVALAGNLSIGNSKILGLPFHLPGAAWVLREEQDGAVATAGTFVAGVNTIPSGTTGDVRGTWTPNATLNGSIGLSLFVLCPDPTYRGLPQFAG